MVQLLVALLVALVIALPLVLGVLLAGEVWRRGSAAGYGQAAAVAVLMAVALAFTGHLSAALAVLAAALLLVRRR